MLRAPPVGLRRPRILVGGGVHRDGIHAACVSVKAAGLLRRNIPPHVRSAAYATVTQPAPLRIPSRQVSSYWTEEDTHGRRPPHWKERQWDEQEIEETAERPADVEDEYLVFADELEPQSRPTLRIAHYEPGPLRSLPRISQKSEAEEQSPASLRADWLDVLGTTTSLDEAWQAYNTLSALPEESFPLVQPKNGGPALQIPHRYLHRFSAMLASTRPSTRDNFLRLQAVLTTIDKTGGRLRLWQWNALIHAAGAGFRKLTPADTQRALDMFTDLVKHLPPGTTLAEGYGSAEVDVESEEHPHPPSSSLTLEPSTGPDIITYTTLLDLAVRTGHMPLIQHVRGLLQQSGLKPTAVTHRVLLRYFTRTRNMAGVRDTLSRMRSQGLALGREGVNAAAWAFGYNGHLDIADAIYRVVRAPLSLPGALADGDAREPSGHGSTETTRRYLDEVENVIIPEDFRPDPTTYTLLVQAFTYHGRLVPALRIFHDMLMTPNHNALFLRHPSPALPVEEPANVEHGGAGAPGGLVVEPSPTPMFDPIYPIYRALFLGFAKNAVPQRSAHGGRPVGAPGRRIALFYPHSTRYTAAQLAAAQREGWTHDLLYSIFKSFMTLPRDTRPSARVVYWILRAFERATDGDIQKLRKVYVALEKRFGGGWGGRLAQAEQVLFPERKLK
jgi:hypothetical protein